MNGPRYTFKTLPPEWRDCEGWPPVDLTTASTETRERFDRFARGMRLYLQKGRLTAAAREAGCCGAVLIDMLNRCVHFREDGQLVGWAGLISRLRIRGYTRTKVNVDGQATGHAGSFQQFLRDHQEKREKLHEIIRAGGARRSIPSHAPTLRSVFRTFRTWCLSEDMTEDDYPWNTKSGGRRSIERYASGFIISDPRSAKVWYGAEAATGLSLGTGQKSFPFAGVPLDVVGLDAHKLHCMGVVVVNGPAGPQKVPVERLWFCPVLDKFARCVWGYSVSIRKEISAANVEEALVSCSRQWSPRKLIVSGQSYIEGAGLPVGTIAGLDECRPCMLRVDNAAQHFAKRIIFSARRALGCAIAFGPVGGWWRNAITERLFLTLELYGFQRLPSSTGSHPKDPLRTKPVGNAIKHCITWDELLDLVDVLVANYNATKHRGLGNQTPLQVLRTHMQATDSPFLPRLSAPVTANTPRLGIAVEVRRVAGCATKGCIKRPYVEIDKVHYTSVALSNRFDLLKQPVIVHIDERDMRKVTVFLDSGELIGELFPQEPGWRNTAHTREMRKAINALIDVGDMASDASDYVMAYLERLASRAHREIVERPGRKSKAATVLAEAARLADASIPSVPADEVRGKPRTLPRPIPGHIKQPTWRST